MGESFVPTKTDPDECCRCSVMQEVFGVDVLCHAVLFSELLFFVEVELSVIKSNECFSIDAPTVFKGELDLRSRRQSCPLKFAPQFDVIAAGDGKASFVFQFVDLIDPEFGRADERAEDAVFADVEGVAEVEIELVVVHAPTGIRIGGGLRVEDETGIRPNGDQSLRRGDRAAISSVGK